MKTRKAATQRKSKPQRNTPGAHSSVPTSEGLPRALAGVQRAFRSFKKVLGHQGTVATAAGGYIGVYPVTSSGLVGLCAGWTQASAGALEYRVLGIECQFFPGQNSVVGVIAAGAQTPCMIMLCSYYSGLVQSNLDLIIEGPDAKIVNGLRPFKFTATSKGYNDGMLWTPCNSAVVAAEQYGIVLSDQTATIAGPANTTMYRFAIRYLVEFRALI